MIHGKDFYRNCSVHEGYKISFWQKGCWFKGLYMVSLLFEFKKNCEFLEGLGRRITNTPPHPTPESAYEF